MASEGVSMCQVVVEPYIEYEQVINIKKKKKIKKNVD